MKKNIVLLPGDGIGPEVVAAAKQILAAVETRFEKSNWNYVEILVSDTGCGIPKEDTDKIFDPFFTSKDVGNGTGLGLSISYGIIQDHKGNIEVSETGSDGTTFSVKLPVLSSITA